VNAGTAVWAPEQLSAGWSRSPTPVDCGLRPKRARPAEGGGLQHIADVLNRWLDEQELAA
jgi:hypothetical protein